MTQYSPEMHGALLEFLKGVYPSRRSEYLNWWLSNMDDAGSECWNKCWMTLDDGKIVGCIIVNPAHLLVKGKVCNIYFSANTILSELYRGKGLSKKMYATSYADYSNWIGSGFTAAGWKIQPRYVKDFYPIHPVNVYVSVTRYVWTTLIQKISKKAQLPHKRLFPNQLRINKKEELKKIENLEELNIPEGGKWTGDASELVRDEQFLRKRFCDIYCSDNYHFYKYIENGISIGYMVFREIKYKEVPMLSIVDYRFINRAYENRIFKAATKMARSCKLGFVMCLSSRKYKLQLSPLAISLKKLKSATGISPGINPLTDLLITSADSDLDFVYYK